MTRETLSILDALGLNPEDIEWRDLALCQGQKTSKWYEGYESSVRTAKLTDQVCLSCPVRKECLQAGVENSEYGCWGGVFLTAGKMDEAKNAHKTPDIWKQIRDGIQ